jgi:hypothetical protein
MVGLKAGWPWQSWLWMASVLCNRPRPERLRRGYRGSTLAFQRSADGCGPEGGKGEEVHVACAGHEAWRTRPSPSPSWPA